MLSAEDTQAIDRAADFLEWYADFIRRDVMSADIERHPYLPELEGVASDLRSLTRGADAPADWGNRHTRDVSGWINELRTLTEHPEVRSGWLGAAMKTIARGLTAHAPVAAPAPSALGQAAPREEIVRMPAAIWIPVARRLPEKRGCYWTYQPSCPPQSHPMRAVRFDPRGGHWFSGWPVTHWMELPDVPGSGP